MNQRFSDAHNKLCKAIASGKEAEISKAKDHFDSVSIDLQKKLFPENESSSPKKKTRQNR